jgi:hypothetical protein
MSEKTPAFCLMTKVDYGEHGVLQNMLCLTPALQVLLKNKKLYL